MAGNSNAQGPRWRADDLTKFAFDLLGKAGMADDRARIVADILVEGDLMGHTTHGLQLLGPYLKNIESGDMLLEGEPDILADNGAVRSVDGRYLPGPWLVVSEMEELCERAQRYGTATGVIRRSHHIAALAAYLKPVTDRGLMVLLSCSDPETFTVAPHGGQTPWCSPNPLAAGIPTDGEPILIDISMSTTTNGLSMRLSKQGKRLPGQWVKDADGEPTDDPSVVFADPPGAIMPLGGIDLGHKGFALGLIVEALTAGLAGHGRADGIDHWGATVFIQVLDPRAFGGAGAFTREMSWSADYCRNSKVKPGDPPVRMPGEGALARRAAALSDGVELYPGIMDALQEWAGKLGVTMPEPQE
jgi:LDH2 family malate/lactate/ureidoglycolate dehydrogenase